MPHATAAAAHPELLRPESPPVFGGRPPGGVGEPPVSNARLALVLFMGAETMLFTALLGAHVLFRASSLVWPPPGQPYLPVEATWVNTALLTFSAATMRRAVEAIRADRAATMRASLLGTAVLGAIFLIAQGSEWVRLVNHGLTLSSSVYGSMFYSLIGLHGLHVLGAVGWLGVVFLGAVRGRYSAERRTAVELCALYWYFVCGLWIVLFGLVYLG